MPLFGKKERQFKAKTSESAITQLGDRNRRVAEIGLNKPAASEGVPTNLTKRERQHLGAGGSVESVRRARAANRRTGAWRKIPRNK